MANTYTALYYQIVFSTKHRHRWITQMWNIASGPTWAGSRENKMTALKVGGIEDHVHILLGAPPTIAPSKAAQLIKGGSSTWIHERFPLCRVLRGKTAMGPSRLASPTCRR